jgi:hypothetical protein
MPTFIRLQLHFRFNVIQRVQGKKNIIYLKTCSASVSSKLHLSGFIKALKSLTVTLACFRCLEDWVCLLGSRNVVIRRWLYSGLLRCVVWLKFTYFSEVLAASVIRAMMRQQAPWNIGKLYQTARRNNPENNHLHTRRLENSKSNRVIIYL